MYNYQIEETGAFMGAIAWMMSGGLGGAAVGGLAGLSIGQIMYIGGMSGAGASLFGDLGDTIFKGDDISTGQALHNMVVSGALGATLAGAGHQLDKLWGGLKERLFKPNASKPYSGSRNPESDFTNARGNSTLQNHFDRHGRGFNSANEYLSGARSFLEKPATSTTQSFISNEGTYFRYDTLTNEFGVMNKHGGVSTYYKPDDGLSYWLDQIKLYGPK